MLTPVLPSQDIFAQGLPWSPDAWKLLMPTATASKSRVDLNPPICSGLLILVFQPSFQTGGLGVPMQGRFPLVHGPEPQAVPSGSQLVFHRHLHRFSPSYVKFPAFSRLEEMLLRPRLLGLLEASRLHLEEQLLGGPGGALPWNVAPCLPWAVSRSPGLL